MKTTNLSGITQSNIPKYIINLDVKPENRWDEVIKDYKHKLPKLVKEIDAMVREAVGSEFLKNALKTVVNTFFSVLASAGGVYYHKELSGIATKSGIPLGLLTFMQLSYELCACCTSMITQQHSTPLHVRSMDWGLDFLAEYTIEVEFQKNGVTIATATTWAGYIGVLTGMRHHSYSISINYRNLGTSFANNIKQALTGGWPIGFLVRESMVDATNYETAVAYLSNSSLIAPVYITVCGTKKGDGVLITRNRKGAENVVNLDKLENEAKWIYGKNLILQTNRDWWIPLDDKKADDILDSVDRLKIVSACVGKVDKRVITVDDILKIYAIYPVQNELTIYVTVMIPQTNTYYTILIDAVRKPQMYSKLFPKPPPSLVASGGTSQNDTTTGPPRPPGMPASDNLIM